MMCVFHSMCQEQIEATKNSWYANTHTLNKKVLKSVLIRSRSCTKNEDLDKKELKPRPLSDLQTVSFEQRIVSLRKLHRHGSA